MHSAQRFESLDGLRGVAAFAVLLLHIHPYRALQLAPNGFLAVDFFFVLSGFVIASAYDTRLTNSLSFRQFLILRLIRLYPLIVLGIILGAIGYARLYSPPRLVLLFVTGLLLIPTPYGAVSEDRIAIALNPPSWSLLWELLANTLYAGMRPILNNGVLLAAIVVFAGWLAFAGWVFGTLNIGGIWTNAWAGAPRVGFSFFLGVALLRARRWPAPRRFRIPLVPAAVALTAVMATPVPAALVLPFDLVAVMLVFPAIVAGCANAAPGRLTSTCVFLGAVSYPAYILQSGILPHLRGLPEHLHLGVVGATIASVAMSAGFVGFAWLVWRYYDQPIRKWLGRKTSARPSPASAAMAP